MEYILQIGAFELIKATSANGRESKWKVEIRFFVKRPFLEVPNSMCKLNCLGGKS